MSLYANYLAEKTDRKIIENDFGFVIYSFNKDSVYLEDIYIDPPYRKQGYARMLSDLVADKAREENIKKMYGSVIPSTKDSNDSIKALQAYGMKLESCTNNFIVFSKEI